MTKNCNCNNQNPQCTQCVKEVCLDLPYTFSVNPSDPAQTATFTDTYGESTRWTQAGIPFPKITSFKDEDLLTFELHTSACEFDFTENYNYVNGNIPSVLSVNPCSDITPISIGETVTMSTTVASVTSPVYVLYYDKYTKSAYNPATGGDDVVGSGQYVTYTIDNTTTFAVYQIDTPTKLQVSLNKKVGFNSLVLRLKTCGCVDIVNSTSALAPFENVKDFFINGVFFMRYSAPVTA